jgi:hypothetical protein
MTDRTGWLRRLLSVAALVVFLLGLAVLFGVGVVWMRGMGAQYGKGGETTEGLVLKRDGQRALVRFSYNDQTWEQWDDVDPRTENPQPGDKVAVVVFGVVTRGKPVVVSHLESARDLYEVGLWKGLAVVVALFVLAGGLRLGSRFLPTGTHEPRREQEAEAVRPGE